VKERTKDFAMRVVRLYASLPRSVIAQTLGKQALRSGTSVGAHYREAIRSRSDAEYASKIEGALQELEETGYWEFRGQEFRGQEFRGHNIQLGLTRGGRGTGLWTAASSQ
jgi:four helix bundle protein